MSVVNRREVASPGGTTTIHVIAAIELVQGKRDEFLEEFGKLVPLVRAELAAWSTERRLMWPATFLSRYRRATAWSPSSKNGRAWKPSKPICRRRTWSTTGPR